ncbi:hypothetical protein NPIL_32331 [Nephila pilipes]|uniref:Uncharacterized protein n=1 Tax=Nephila pilipes TaxID=299642 RepID=A0A8X6UCB2_NEPPI|nr:hypothetical protein NPIL_32331 [Nephila pilipes]
MEHFLTFKLLKKETSTGKPKNHWRYTKCHSQSITHSISSPIPYFELKGWRQLLAHYRFPPMVTKTVDGFAQSGATVTIFPSGKEEVKCISTTLG